MVRGHSGVILVHARKLVDLACAFGPGAAQSHALSLAGKLVPETENTWNFVQRECPCTDGKVLIMASD